MSGARPPRRRDFPGWRMVWAVSVTETVAYGVLFYSFAVFLVPMRAELGASTAELSGALTLSLALTGIAAVGVGRWLDRHGARWLMTGGSLLAAGSVAGWSQARDLTTLYLAFAGVGLAGAAVLYEPAYALINTWFRRDRQAALLTLTVIAGFASAIFVPLAQLLIDGLGWRAALLVLAGLLAACAVPHAVLLRRSPADLGLPPDGRQGEETSRLPAPGAATPPRSGAFALPAVRRLTLAAALEMFAITVVAVHLVAFLLADGVGAGTAAVASGSLGALSVAGRLVLTALSRRTGLARTTAVMVTGQAVGVVLLLLLPRPLGIPLFVVLFGLGFGVLHIARPAMLGEFVDPAVFGSVSGGQALVAQAGRVVAPVTAGALAGAFGYGTAFAAVAGCTLAAGALILGAERAHSRAVRPAGRPPSAPAGSAGARSRGRSGPR